MTLLSRITVHATYDKSNFAITDQTKLPIQDHDDSQKGVQQPIPGISFAEFRRDDTGFCTGPTWPQQPSARHVMI